MNYYAWKMRVPRCQCFSHQINNQQPWQLKKSKSWGPFWSYQLNSTASLWYMFLHSTRQFQCYHTGWLNKETFYQIKLKEQIQHAPAPVAEQPLRLDSTELRWLTDVVSMGGLEKNKRLCYSHYGWPFGCITHSSALLDHRGPCTYLTHQGIVLCSTVWVDLQ